MATLVVYPLLLVGILGYAFSEPQTVKVALVNEDRNDQGQPNQTPVPDPITGQPSNFLVSSQMIVDRLQALGVIDVVETTQEQGRQLLLAGQVQAVVRFPQGFSQAVAELGTSGTIHITIDQSDLTRSQIMQLTIIGLIDEFKQEVVEQKVELVVNAIETSLKVNLPTTSPLYPGFEGVKSRLRAIRDNLSAGDENGRRLIEESLAFLDSITDTLQQGQQLVESVAQPVNSNIQGETSDTDTVRDLVVPAAVGLSIFWTGTISTGSLLVYERGSPTYGRLKISPTGAGAIYGSKVLLTGIIILLQTALILAVIAARWANSIDNPALTFLVIVVSTFASVGLGVFLASFSRDVNTTVLLSVLMTFPMLFLSGLFYPIDFMPRAAQLVAGAFPLTYTVHGLRGSMLRGFTLADGLGDVLVLTVMGMGLFLAGIVVARIADRRR